MDYHIIFEALKYLGLTSLPFSIFFGFSKVGYRVEADYKWTWGMFYAPGISSVTLVNLKDRPIPIFGIQAVTGDYSINLIEMNPPVILRGLEATVINIPPVSARYIGNDPFEWKDTALGGLPIDIYIHAPKKVIKCRPFSASSALGTAFRRNLFPVTNSTRTFNDRVYNENVLYAVVYREGSEQKTAFIDRSGFIDWSYAINRLPAEALTSREAVFEKQSKQPS